MTEFTRMVNQIIHEGTTAFLQTKDINILKKNNAGSIASLLKKDRTYVSRYFNEGLKQHEFIKINTRPVLFLDASDFKDYHLDRYEYNSIEELLQILANKREEVIIKSIIGYHDSMKIPIEQAKTSLAYPNNGLPMIIFGESGVGKSFFAKKIYMYAKDKEILKENAPFVTVNCAQYANNPELLSSMLFGYVKGSFTGADKTHEGALSSADGGILFLDEVHRLSGEGQEKLFTYLDEGYFTMIGDNVTHHKAKIRLICATTESSSTFLTTFLRRLPIQIKLPGLNDRPVNEKKELIDSFFQNEAIQFQQNIELSGRTLSILLSYSFPENVGQLKTAIKYAVANAHEKHGLNQTVKVTVNNLPAWMYVKDKNDFQNIMSLNAKTIYHFNEAEPDTIQSQNLNTILINNTWDKVTKAVEHNVTDKKIYVNLIKDAMDEIIFNRPNENQDILMQFFVDTVRQMLTLFNDTNTLLYDGNLVLGIASFLYDSVNSKPFEENDQRNSKLLIDLFSAQFKIVKKMGKFLYTQLDRQLTEKDCVWLAVYISTSNNLLEQEDKNIGIIITHGYATASSIANLCNRILHNNVFLAINMPINSTPEDIGIKLQKIISAIDSSQGIVVLFDMGSLSQIAQGALEYTKRPILLIDKVTTAAALEVGNALVMGKSLNNISKLINKDWLPKAKLCQPQIEKENIILAVCMTGIGTAQQIKLMLENSFMNVRNLRVVATDFKSLKNKGTKLENLEQYHVICIVGTDNPMVKEVPYVSMQSLITGDGTTEFDKIISPYFDVDQIKKVNKNLIRNFSLTRVIDNLTILDTDKVMTDIEEFISKLEGYLQTTISNKVKMTLFVHVSSMIERLIRRESVDQYPKLEEKINENKKLYSVLKSTISVLEKKYRIQVSDAEIAYIIDITAFK